MNDPDAQSFQADFITVGDITNSIAAIDTNATVNIHPYPILYPHYLGIQRMVEDHTALYLLVSCEEKLCRCGSVAAAHHSAKQL